jgi:ribosome hibernation promoting factor
MKFLFTSRHFKAHDSLKEFAEQEVEKIGRFYDGVIKAEVILSFEKVTNSIKIAEFILNTNNHHTFTAKAQSEDFKISIEGAADRIVSQLKKYKEKIKTNHSPKQIDSLKFGT